MKVRNVLAWHVFDYCEFIIEKDGNIMTSGNWYSDSLTVYGDLDVAEFKYNREQNRVTIELL